MKRVALSSLMAIFTAALVCMGALSAFAAFPDHEIRLIVPYKAGGQSDLTARKLAEIIQAKHLLPVPIIVVNIPGANTQEGLRNAMQAKPDGYTLLLHHSAFVTMKALGQIPMSWHDMEMVGQAMEMANSLVVNSSSPFLNATQFIDEVNKNPGKYKIAIPGLGGVAHLALLDFLVNMKIQDKVEILPFDGANEAVTALMGNRADARTAPNADMARFVKSGEQRAILVMGKDKLPGINAAQYAPELELENMLVLRNGIFAPRNTPKKDLEIIAKAFREAVDSREFQEFAANQAARARFLDAEEWAEVFKNDEKTVDNIVKYIIQK